MGRGCGGYAEHSTQLPGGHRVVCVGCVCTGAERHQLSGRDESGLEGSLLPRLQEPGQVPSASVRVPGWLVSEEEFPTLCSQ